MWPQLKIVHGKPHHSQSQGSVERANRDVEEMIRAWMIDNDSTQWNEEEDVEEVTGSVINETLVQTEESDQIEEEDVQTTEEILFYEESDKSDLIEQLETQTTEEILLNEGTDKIDQIEESEVQTTEETSILGK
ncbi:KRAB-A domain-containing protein 2-like [Photinus pyralis]|uniref:KRAB-A domain-containing protein 2-like n=1 Tax=Photinus pyralis TaxID=7054 RepID=UPI001266F4E0|nr:KRAB-A domain-containing protein 2-like [Photinus pyralis]